MEPHQERVLQEQAELVDKIEKLNSFRTTSAFGALPSAEQDRLNRQLRFMELYSGVLAERIQAFQ